MVSRVSMRMLMEFTNIVISIQHHHGFHPCHVSVDHHLEPGHAQG